MTHEIKYRNKKYKIIPENFANMSDIYRLLAYLKPAYDYSSTSDNRSKSNINNMKRLSRIFGFDYHSTKKDLVFMLSKKIFTIHMDHISSNIKYHLQQKYVKTKDLKIVGIGIGKFLIRLICKKNNWRYIDFNEYCTHKTVGIYQPSDIAPAYSLIPLLSNYEKNT